LLLSRKAKILMKIKHGSFLTVILFFHSFVLSSQTYPLTTPFDPSNVPPAADYSKASSWAALPFIKDEADFTPAGLINKQDSAAVDVFFIHPTMYWQKPSDQYTWNADIINAKLNKLVDERPIHFQASVFNGSCKVYAPRYRQAHYYSFLTTDTMSRNKALDLAYQDVRQAFMYYLQNYNHGRPIVIASHSQGTIHAVRLLQEFFLSKPLLKQLVVAYLPGNPVSVQMLPGIPPCSDSIQTTCFNCWNTFRKNYIPDFYAKGLNRSVCTNPISWTLDEKYISAGHHKGAYVPPFKKISPGVCDAQAHKGLLWVTRPQFRGSFLYKTGIYHSGDYNLFYMDVRENVALRIKEYQSQQLH
jgi:hypothetical protein